MRLFTTIITAVIVMLNVPSMSLCSEPLKATVQINDSPSAVRAMPGSGYSSPASNSTTSIANNAQIDNSTTAKEQTSIDVQEKIKPLDPLLCPGNYFDKQVATALLKKQKTVSDTWKKISDWQAGSWESKQATMTRSIDYVNGKPTKNDEALWVYTCKIQETFGWLKDRNGDIWNRFDSGGYWTETDYDSRKTYSYIRLSAPGVGEYPDYYTESVSFNVDSKTNKITTAAQRRCWNRYTSVAPGIKKEESVNTSYDEQGQPKLSAWNTTLSRRIEPFSAYDGKLADEPVLLKSFIAYLKSNGLETLIPTQYAASIGKNTSKRSAPAYDYLSDLRAHSSTYHKALPKRTSKVAMKNKNNSPH